MTAFTGKSNTVTVPLASKRFSFSQNTSRKFRNGTKIAWESFLNIRKWLPFRNADHSMENFGGSRKDIPENLCLPCYVHLSEIPENAVSFATGNFRKFNREYFCGMERHLGFESAHRFLEICIPFHGSPGVM